MRRRARDQQLVLLAVELDPLKQFLEPRFVRLASFTAGALPELCVVGKEKLSDDDRHTRNSA